MAESASGGARDRGARAGPAARLPRWLQEAIPPSLLGLFLCKIDDLIDFPLFKEIVSGRHRVIDLLRHYV